MHNKLYTKSYFKKRLIESNYFVTDINIHFDNNDDRKWVLLLNKKNHIEKNNILITCFYKSPIYYWFEIQTKKVSNYKIFTKSMNVIIEQLRQFELS